MTGAARGYVLVQIALRNLLSHRWKTVIVGSIMLFGTFLVVLGGALLDSVQATMSQSITQSIAGHLQIYDSEARDDVALFGQMLVGQEDIGVISDFAKVKAAVLALPNIEAIVPMGISFAQLNPGNEFDQVLDTLTTAVRTHDQAAIAQTRDRIDQMAGLLRADFAIARSILSDPTETDKGLAALDRVQDEAFWASLQSTPDAALQWLDTNIAPLAAKESFFFMRYLGVDLESYTKHFDRFQIVKGEMVPAGKRGFLFNQKFYDEIIKNKVARALDVIKEARDQDHKTIAGDAVLASKVKQMSREYARITLQLDPARGNQVRTELQTLLASTEPNLNTLIEAFLSVDDTNFDTRYDAFYRIIAPRIKLYEFAIGDTITLSAPTKAGYLKSLNLKAYGTFTFKGLEASDLAAGHNLVDIMSFRDLYGLMTEERRHEIEGIRETVGVAALDRASAEEELFGTAGATVVEQDASEAGFDEFEGRALARGGGEEDRLDQVTYSQEQIDAGVALNAAILLKDPTRIAEAKVALEQMIAKEKLRLKVVDWQTASGIAGQFVVVIRLVLYIAIFIIFAVALVIINNSMVTATMERIDEIGTMRAIGAQRRFVLMMFLLETIVLGFLAGAMGSLLAVGLVLKLGHTGIPAAGQDILVFLFSGPRLYPVVTWQNGVMGMVAILVVSIISTLYPARVATRIQPVVAMQGKG